jgi:hypothetical protein
MPRAAANQAKNLQKTEGKNAAEYGGKAAADYGPLNSQANSLINSPGYDPATLGAITNAGMGGVNAAFGDAAGQVNRNAARSGNAAGVGGNLDTLARDKGIAGGQEAGDIQIQNAQFQNQQRMAGLNLLNSLYATNVGAQTGNEANQNQAISTEAAASPGWVQNATGIIGAIGSAIPKPKA